MSLHKRDSSFEPVDIAVEELNRRQLSVIARMNVRIFEEDRIINSFAREDLMILLATVSGTPAGFKIGYRENKRTFYSAKGGVMPAYRRQGIARRLLFEMMDRAHHRGYDYFTFDTFPNKHPGMAILAMIEGFRLTLADYNPTYKDHRLRFEYDLRDYEPLFVRAPAE